MDDNTFDKKIKEKADNYRDTGFDEHALQGFRDRMSGVAYQPWYAPYNKIAGYAAAVVIISLINFGLFSYYYQDRDQALLADMQALRQKKLAYDQLKRDYQLLKASRVDTVYVYKEIDRDIRQAANSATQDEAAKMNNKDYQLVAWYGSSGDGHIKLGAAEELSEEIKTFLARYKLAYQDEEGDVYLHRDNREEPRFVSRRGYDDQLSPGAFDVMIASLDEEITPKSTQSVKTKKQRLSVAVLREIEKQKMDGVGFQYGPEVDLLKANVDLGDGGPGVNIGMTAEFILSPALRVESGIKYHFLRYNVSGADDLQSPKISAFPAIQSELGAISDIRVDNHSAGFPIHLKYNYPLARDHYVFASVGVTPQMLFLQKMNYLYQYDIDTGNEDDYAVNIEASKRVDDVYLKMGTMDFALGIEKKLKNKSILQLSAFYDRSINTIGVEEREMAMVGVRSALKFRVK